METQEGNRLIMFFDGAVNDIIEIMGKEEKCIKYKNSYYPAWNLPKFHEDWNLLMPVVGKIEGKEIDLNVSVVIKNNLCRIYRHKNSPYEVAVTPLCDEPTKIQATWQAVIQFIQWYNSITPDKK